MQDDASVTELIQPVRPAARHSPTPSAPATATVLPCGTASTSSKPIVRRCTARPPCRVPRPRNPRTRLGTAPVLQECALITDGRFSGGSHGFVIGHVSPEAQVGGPIALVKVRRHRMYADTHSCLHAHAHARACMHAICRSAPRSHIALASLCTPCATRMARVWVRCPCCHWRLCM